MTQDFFNERDHGMQVISEIRTDIDAGSEADNFRYENFAPRFIDSVKEANVFVDAGAEYGFYAYLAIRNMPKNGVLHLFEPEPVRIELLSDFMQPYPSVTVHPKAVSGSAGVVTLHKPKLTVSSTIDGAVAQYGNEDLTPVAYEVETASLDEVFKGVDIDVLKMDIEGAEVLAFEGMRDILAKGRTKIFIEFHRPYVESIRPGGMALMQTMLDESGYRCFHCDGEALIPCDIERGRVYLVPPGVEP